MLAPQLVVRLHSAIGCVTPADKLAGREKEIFERRDRKLAEARQARAQRRQAVHAAPPVPPRLPYQLPRHSSRKFGLAMSQDHANNATGRQNGSELRRRPPRQG